MDALPVMTRYRAVLRVSVGPDAFTSMRHLRRFVFLTPVVGAAARDTAVKRLLDAAPPAREGFRRGVAAVTWDLIGRELTVRVVDREAP